MYIFIDQNILIFFKYSQSKEIYFNPAVLWKRLSARVSEHLPFFSEEKFSHLLIAKSRLDCLKSPVRFSFHLVALKPPPPARNGRWERGVANSCHPIFPHLLEQLHSPTSWIFSAQYVFCTWGRSSLQCVRTRARCCVMFEHNLIAATAERAVCYPSSSTGHLFFPTETTDLHSHTICPQLRQHAL